MNGKIARTLGFRRQFGCSDFTHRAVESRDIDALALTVGKSRKRRRVGAPVDEVLFPSGGDAPGQKRCGSGSAEKCASFHLEGFAVSRSGYLSVSGAVSV